MLQRFFIPIQAASGFRVAFLTAGLLFVLLLSTRAQTPIAHYSLDGNANDAGGNGLNGTIVGTLSPVADRFGNPNSAMAFDGNPANRIEIADNPLLHSGNVTLMAWVKLNNLNSIQSIIDKPLNTCTNDSWHFATEGANYSGWVNTGASGCSDLVQMTTPGIAGVWRHVAFVVDADADVRKLYVNGVEMATASYPQTILYDANPVFLGGCLENNSLVQLLLRPKSRLNLKLEIQYLWRLLPLPIIR
jgi:hypothetical protein